MTDRSDKTHTVDGVEITPGLWVWDNNLDSVQVDPEQWPGSSRYRGDISGVGGQHWDGWYDMLRADGSRAHIMNGERMVTVFEGLRAADFPGVAYGDAKRSRDERGASMVDGWPDEPTDTQVIDAIGGLLGTTKDWNADTLRDIANLIGQVRPHPGDDPNYSSNFRAATGRPLPSAWNFTRN
jgi:hypothetical protein